jgi:hypothetical protein
MSPSSGKLSVTGGVRDSDSSVEGLLFGKRLLSFIGKLLSELFQGIPFWKEVPLKRDSFILVLSAYTQSVTNL